MNLPTLANRNQNGKIFFELTSDVACYSLDSTLLVKSLAKHATRDSAQCSVMSTSWDL